VPPPNKAMDKKIGKKISRKEACQIALDILREAEEKRRQYAEREASIPAVWEDEGDGDDDDNSRGSS